MTNWKPWLAVRRSDVVLFVALAGLFTLLILPGAQGSPFAGTPASSLARLALVGLLSVVAFVVVFRPTANVRATWLGLLLGATVLKLLAGTQAATHGWRGVYEITDRQPTTPARFVWQLGRHDYRIDRRLEFYDRAFGLHFINDVQRYVARFDLKQRDVDLPMRMSWTGHFRSPGSEPAVVFVKGNGHFAIALDGRQLWEHTNPHWESVTLPKVLPEQPFALRVTYEKPATVVPSVSLTVMSGDRILDPTPWPDAAVSATRHRAAVVTSMLSVLLGAVSVAGLLIGAYRPGEHGFLESRTGGDWLGGLACVAMCGGFAWLAWSYARPFTGGTVHLFAGDDPFFYESAATEILHNGLLMSFGAEPGQGSAYYFYPLYPYIRAATQLLVGEDFAVSMLFSGFCLALLPLLFWTLGWSALRPRWLALAALMTLGGFLTRHVFYYTVWGYTDVLFIFLVFLTLNLVRLSVQRMSRGLAFAAGLGSALTAACRPSFMTFLPVLVMVAICVPAIGPFSARRRLAVFLLIGWLVGLAPFATRNYVMSGKPVLLVESWIQIPYFLVPPEIPNTVGLRAGMPPPTLGESVAWAWSIVREHPTRSLLIELRKIAFTLGFTNLGMPGDSFYHRFHIEFVLLTLGFFIAAARNLLPLATAVTLGCFALSHVAAMVLAAPWTYGYKSILPLQLVFLFATGAAASRWWATRRAEVTQPNVQPAIAS